MDKVIHRKMKNEFPVSFLLWITLGIMWITQNVSFVVSGKLLTVSFEFYQKSRKIEISAVENLWITFGYQYRIQKLKNILLTTHLAEKYEYSNW